MKTSISISVEEEDAEVLRRMCAAMGISMAKLFEEAVKGYVMAGKSAGLHKQKKASVANLIRMFGKGCTMEPHS
jgi:hypothetical protein